MQSGPLNARQKRHLAQIDRQHKKQRAIRQAEKLKQDQKMRYTPKERSVYRKALRYGRTLKPGGEFKAVPRLKFNGGGIAVRRDKKGNVSVRVNSATRGVITELGPRGSKRQWDMFDFSPTMMNQSSSTQNMIVKRARNLLSIVGKGAYKHGSTGNAGG